jgi:CubicO group peptidase (beta-lactamase class C family)
MIEGTCDERFARVRDAFGSNFSEHAEIGAAIAVYAGGRLVVDLWGGFSDAARTRPWHERTLVDVFSVGKGIATLIVLDAVSRGELALDSALARNAYQNPSDLSGAGTVNGSGWRQAEIPSANLHASARGVACVYAALIRGDLLPASLLREAAREHSQGVDRVLDRPSRFGLGFQLTHPERPLGPNAGAFGHFGAGGALGFCDPEAGIGFGYVMNDMGARWQNPRNRALVDSVYASL